MKYRNRQNTEKNSERKNKSSRKNYFYYRLIAYPFLIFIFIFATYQLQNYSTKIHRNKDYQFLSVSLPEKAGNRYDVTFYDIALEVEIDSSLQSGVLNGRAKIRFRSTVNGLKDIRLNFTNRLSVDSIPDAESFHHKNSILKIKLGYPLQKNEFGEVEIFYHGWPSPYHEWIQGWRLHVHTSDDSSRSPWLCTMNPPFGAQTWFPCKDDPADKADSARFRVTVPENLTVVCNGKLVNIRNEKDGHRTFIWKETYPISVYLMAVNFGEFSLFTRQYIPPAGRSFPVQIYCFPEDSFSVDLVFTQLMNMLDYFIGVLGPYPFDREKYAMVVFPVRGGMENQTVSSVHQITPRRENLYAHELIHQWIGDMVTHSSFHDSWIQEGLATYFTGLYLKHYYGESAFHNFMKTHLYLKKGKIRVEKILIPDSVYHYGRVYGKGSWFFYMLHQIIGDDAFFEGIRHCLQTYAYRNISSDELREIFEQESNRDLSYFFTQWTKQPYTPILKCKVELQNTTQSYNQYSIEIKQIQKGTHPYILPIEMKFSSSRRDTVLVFEIHKKKQKFITYLPFQANSIELDPDQKLLIASELEFRKVSSE